MKNKNVKLNVLNVSALLAPAVFTTGVAAGPVPADSDQTTSDAKQGKWVKRVFENINELPSSLTVKAGTAYHWNSSQDVYVCRIGKLPGKWIVRNNDEDKCYTAYAGREVSSTEFEVLNHSVYYTYRYSWKDYTSYIANNGLFATRIVKGGSESGRNLYICRAKYYNDHVVGKYVPEHKACYFEYNGSEHHYRADLTYTQFEVLVQEFYNPGTGGNDPLPGGDEDGNMY